LNPNEKPKQAEVVAKLMSHEGDDPKDKEKMIFKCLRVGCRKPYVSKFKGSGFTNPYNHLKRCYGDEEEVLRVFKRMKEEEDADNLASMKNFAIPTTNARERAMHGWIVAIVLEGLPVKSVENKVFRSLFKYNEAISIKALVRTIFQLVILVEQKISKEIAKTSCGAIMHDAWTRSGIHYYVALFACYVKEKKNKQDPERCCTLLAVTPMPTADGQSQSEAVRFRADEFCNFFEHTLKDFYKVDIKKWCKAIIADNAPTNIKITKDLKIPHVGCYSHKLSLDVEEMVKASDDMKNTIAKVHDVMACAKQKLRNAALLRNITDLRPILENKTWWSGKAAMLVRFIRLRDKLIEAADNKESDGLDNVLDRSTGFLSKTQKYEKWMSCINTITLKLQERCLPLSKAHHLMEFLESEIASRREKEFDQLNGCTYTRVKSHLGHPDLCPNRFFETGVVKIQLGSWPNMTDAEKRACRSLLKSSVSDEEASDSESDQSGSPDPDHHQEPGSPDFEARAQKFLEEKEKDDQAENPYVNCNFVYGSTAEVERLWSVASYVLTKQRRRMTPQLFESILFLRYNERFWDQTTVAEAMKEDAMEQHTARLERRIRDDETEESILEAADNIEMEE
jgi:hypothetical protein